MTRGRYLRKFAAVVFAFFVLLVTLADAQQIDIAAGASTLMSPTSSSDLVSFRQPAEKNGTYINISADFVGLNRRLGLEVETSFRYHQAFYPYNGETYRPFLSALNVLYQPQVTKRIGLDLVGGVGIATTRFNGTNFGCISPTIGCINYLSSNHFMEDLGAGVRYYFWRRFFIGPEIHYYHIQNNREFNSNNVFRAGASIGLTLGPR